MKSYWVKYGEFANSYALRKAWNASEGCLLILFGYQRITRKEAERLARVERRRRRENPQFAGYADDTIKFFNRAEFE